MANANPGLMQAYGPTSSGTCKDVAKTSRCPTEMILQMIVDGTAHNSADMGYQDLITKSGKQDVSKFYMAARMYNSGPSSLGANGDLSGSSTGTPSYSSDIANRLLGWTT